MSCATQVKPGDVCRECGPCPVGLGDCDSDSECEDGLVCVSADGGSKDEPGHDICIVPDGNPPVDGPGIRVLGSSTAKSQSGELELSIPTGTSSEDLLLLFLYRTDGPNIWTASELNSVLSTPGTWQGPLASCAIDNSAGDFDCRGQQADLNQVLFYKQADVSDSGANLRIPMPGSKPGWAIMVSVRGADTSDPMRRYAGQSRCDGKASTVFPSVSGAQEGDLLLLSQAFDDGSTTGVESGDFVAPSGLHRLAYVIDVDEAAFLFDEVLSVSGDTKAWETAGPGNSNCKDAPMSILIRPR